MARSLILEDLIVIILLNIFFFFPNVIWNFSWTVLDDPHENDHFPIIILIKSDTPYQFNPNGKSTNSSQNKPSSRPQLIFYKTNWQLFSQLVDSVIPNFPNNVTDSVEKYNEFT